MNYMNIKDVIDVSNKEDIPFYVQQYINFARKILFILNKIKMDENIESNSVLPQLTQTNDSGYESFSNSENFQMFSSKEVSYLLDNEDIKHTVERCLQEIFRFLCTPKIIYKHTLTSIESCKKLMFDLIQYLEENDSIDNVISICKVFIHSLWDSFEREDDLLYLQFIMKIYHEFIKLQFLFFTIVEILLDKLINFTEQMKRKKFDPALMYATNYSDVSNFIVLSLRAYMKEKNVDYLPDHLFDKFFVIIANLESDDEYISMSFFLHKIIVNIQNFENMKITHENNI